MTLQEIETAFEEATRDAAARFEAMAPLGWADHSRGQVVCARFVAECRPDPFCGFRPVWEVRPSNGLEISGPGFTPEEAWPNFVATVRWHLDRHHEPYRQVKEILAWTGVRS